jgi:DNA modification methylase
LRRLIELASGPGDVVLDPFMGVGSTGVAALELGRRFVGIELEEAYVAAARRRIDIVAPAAEPVDLVGTIAGSR